MEPTPPNRDRRAGSVDRTRSAGAPGRVAASVMVASARAPRRWGSPHPRGRCSPGSTSPATNTPRGAADQLDARSAAPGTPSPSSRPRRGPPTRTRGSGGTSTAPGPPGCTGGPTTTPDPRLPLSTATAQARYMVSVTGDARRRIGSPAGARPRGDRWPRSGRSGLSGPAPSWPRSSDSPVDRRSSTRATTSGAMPVGAPADIAARYRLWLPSYPADPNSTTFRPLVPAGFATWTIWQYTSSGSVPGIVGVGRSEPFLLRRRHARRRWRAAVVRPGIRSAASSRSTVCPVVGSRSSGWAIDPDTTGAVDVHLWADGRYAGQLRRTRLGRTSARPIRDSGHCTAFEERSRFRRARAGSAPTPSTWAAVPGTPSSGARRSVASRWGTSTR